MVVPRAAAAERLSLARAPFDQAPARRRYGRRRAHPQSAVFQSDQGRPPQAQRRPRLGGALAQRDRGDDRQRDRLVGPQELRLAAGRAARGHARRVLPARYPAHSAGRAGPARGDVESAGAAAHRRTARDRAPRGRAFHGRGAVAARLPVPGTPGEAAGAARGGRRLQRRRTAAGLPGIHRRRHPSDGGRAVPLQAEEGVSRRVLVVDDEKGIREALTQLLEYEDLEVQACASGFEALSLYPELRPHLVFLDVKMQGMDGLEALRKLRELDPRAQVVMISGHGTIQTAVEATQLGAYDFLEKPLDTDRILLTLRNALEHVDLASENVRLKAEVHAQYEIVGSSRAVKGVIERIEKVAPTAARVLITGENGTGKELVARAIHTLSPRADQPFVEVNCAAIPTELIESELFGHMKGSFTGAFADRAGKFELADGGTLFLDEVGDMSLTAQAKVLRALEEGVISRVGSGKTLAVDVRVVAATNKNLAQQIEVGRFREDLLYRLNVVPIHVPALRERRGDIPQLVAYFSAELTKSGLPGKEFETGAVGRLTAHDWPGNIRELKNAVERLLILTAGRTVAQNDVERLVGKGEGGKAKPSGGGDATWLRAATFEEFKLAAERAFLLMKLQEHDWNVSETARTLQMPRSNLYKKIERYGLSRPGAGGGV